MKDEIKEILHLLKRCDNTYLKIENSNGEKEYEYHQVNDLRLDGYHSQLLLDYITNLQQENERLETNCGELQNAIDNIAELVDVPEGMSVEDVYDKVKDYKSRCEKAIEYIKYNDNDLYIYEPDYDYEENIVDNYEPSSFREDLLNIFKGGSYDNKE